MKAKPIKRRQTRLESARAEWERKQAEQARLRQIQEKRDTARRNPDWRIAA